MKKFRFFQLIFGVHSIHHIQYSAGYKIAFLNYGYFFNFGIKKLGTTKSIKGEIMPNYHNCTLTNKY